MVPPWCIINWLIVYMATALARSLSSSLPSRSPNRVCYGGDLLRIYSSTHLARIIQATVPPPLSPPRQPPASPRLRQRPLRLPGSPPHCGGLPAWRSPVPDVALTPVSVPVTATYLTPMPQVPVAVMHHASCMTRTLIARFARARRRFAPPRAADTAEALPLGLRRGIHQQTFAAALATNARCLSPAGKRFLGVPARRARRRGAICGTVQMRDGSNQSAIRVGSVHAVVAMPRV